MSQNDICQELKDKDDIYAVLVRYAKAADSTDGEALMRSVFHPDAMDEHAGMFSGKIADLIPKMMELRKGFNIMQHVVSNVNIKVDGDFADSECYVTGTQGYIKDGKQYFWLAGGRYVDRMERRNGEWRILNRVSHVDWSRIECPDPMLKPPI